jgi:hypothetical protein
VDHNGKFKIIVFVEECDLNKYYELFLLLCTDGVRKLMIEKSKTERSIETEKLNIRFFIKNDNFKGYRADYVLNLTQDEYFDNLIAKNLIFKPIAGHF